MNKCNLKPDRIGGKEYPCVWLAHSVPLFWGLRNLSAIRDSHLIQTAVLLRVETTTERQL